MMEKSMIIRGDKTVLFMPLHVKGVDRSKAYFYMLRE